MILFAKCLLLFRLFIVVLVVAPWQGGWFGLVHDCCTVLLFVAPCGGDGLVDKC